MFFRHRPPYFQAPASNIFIAFQLINKCEKSLTHSELSVQSGRHLPCLWLVGWLNSGAPTLAIRHHLLKVGILRNIVGTSFLFAKGKKKIKIKSHPPASFSEKKCLRNI